jgi:hypothetical protein
MDRAGQTPSKGIALLHPRRALTPRLACRLGQARAAPDPWWKAYPSRAQRLRRLDPETICPQTRHRRLQGQAYKKARPSIAPKGAHASKNHLPHGDVDRWAFASQPIHSAGLRDRCSGLASALRWPGGRLQSRRLDGWQDDHAGDRERRRPPCRSDQVLFTRHVSCRPPQPQSGRRDRPAWEGSLRQG